MARPALDNLTIDMDGWHWTEQGCQVDIRGARSVEWYVTTPRGTRFTIAKLVTYIVVDRQVRFAVADADGKHIGLHETFDQALVYCAER